MIAKEKANELVDRFLSIEGADDCGNSYSYVAKQCALICVDEMLEMSHSGYQYDAEIEVPFLEEVKQEINKL